MSDKKPLGLIITIIVLAIIVIAMGMTLMTSRNALDNILTTYQRSYPDSILSIQKITGENAKSLITQVNTFCPGFNLSEYYFAQIDNAALQKSLLFIINPETGRIECTLDRSTSINTTKALNQNLLATVNDEPVLMDEVNAVYKNIPEQTRTNSSLQESFDRVIGNKLLLQDAAKKGIFATDSEVEDAINNLLTNNGLSLQQLEQNLASNGLTMEKLRNDIKNSLLMEKEINEVTKNAPLPTEAEIRAYYDANQQSFVLGAKASTRQLLIYANESNADEKIEEIKAIASKLNSTNFCELVTKHSQDLISIPRCGEYDFSQGQLLPEYEQVVFNSTPGTAKIIRTSLGYHIVQILNITAPQQLSYEQAKDAVKNYLAVLNKQAVLNDYITGLRSQAKIVSYLNQPQTTPAINTTQTIE